MKQAALMKSLFHKVIARGVRGFAYFAWTPSSRYLRFEPGVDIGFSEEDFLLDFEKGHPLFLHPIVNGPPADAEIFHQLRLGENFSVHLRE